MSTGDGNWRTPKERLRGWHSPRQSRFKVCHFSGGDSRRVTYFGLGHLGQDLRYGIHFGWEDSLEYNALSDNFKRVGIWSLDWKSHVLL
jgi:hypothetical protein